MLTLESLNDVLEIPTVVENETLPSDEEISRRVKLIRNSWSEAERAERKEEAERRLESLLNELLADHAA